MATLDDRYDAGCAALDELGQQIAAHETDLQALREAHTRLSGRLDELATLQALGLGLTIIPDAAPSSAPDQPPPSPPQDTQAVVEQTSVPIAYPDTA